MAAFINRFFRPNSASTNTTTWSQSTSVSIGHNVPYHYIPVIKGDVNFVDTESTTQLNENDGISSNDIRNNLIRLSQVSIDSIDHEDALEFIYDLFYMHSFSNQHDSRIARLLIENNYCSIVHKCLTEYMTDDLCNNTSIRRSTQFILYTLWNFTGISIEFRLHLTNNKKLIQFLIINFLQYLIESKEKNPHYQMIISNLIQSVISILHNVTLNIHHLNIDQTYNIVSQLLNREPSIKSNERLRLTLLLCLINLNSKEVHNNLTKYQNVFKLLFHFLKKLVQQEILMISTGISAWVITYAINRLPIDIVLADDNRLYSFIILFKRGMREEKVQASYVLTRCIEESTHAKDIIEKDATCWALLQHFKVFVEEE